MALLRRGSSGISEENFNCRLQREHAKVGAITASLAWNDPSDLDLHASAVLAADGSLQHINYRSKRAAGGYLDVDMHARESEIVDEPVENIFWKTPLAGHYSISVKLYKKRGTRESAVPFRAILKREGGQALSIEGAVESRISTVECFRFLVEDDGSVKMLERGTLMPTPTAAPVNAMKAMKVRRAAPRPKATAKAKVLKKLTKVSSIAKGKNAKFEVYKGLKLKTKGGLKKEHLVKSKDGKIVSAKKSQIGRESKWAKATAKARAAKGYTGFKAIKKGSSFYEKAKEFLAEL